MLPLGVDSVYKGPDVEDGHTCVKAVSIEKSCLRYTSSEIMFKVCDTFSEDLIWFKWIIANPMST